MKQKSNAFVVVVVLIGFALCSLAANQLYNWKTTLAPQEAIAKTQFYAGMDKFLSNISWMTLVQWQADDTQRMTDERAEALYSKLNALTDLDPLFAKVYLDGALTLATVKPELSLSLLQKAMDMGMANNNWEVPFYAAHIEMTVKHDAKGADRFFEMAAKVPDAPSYVHSGQMNARCLSVNEEPVASIRFWYDYYTTLGNGDPSQRTLAASQIRDYAQTATADWETKLKDTTDAAARDSIEKDREWVKKVLAELDANTPVKEPKVPTTQAI